MAAPTFVACHQSAWTVTGTNVYPDSGSFAVEAGDLLVAFCAEENAQSSTAGVAKTAAFSGGGLTWNNAVHEYPGTDNNALPFVSFGWAVATATTSITVTATITRHQAALHRGMAVFQFRDSEGVGTHEVDGSSTSAIAPLVSVISERADSAMVCFISDWTASTAGRTWRTIGAYTPTAGNGQEQVYYADGATYAVHGAYWPSVGSVAAHDVGMSAPNQRNGIIGVEVLGIADAAPQLLRPDADTTTTGWTETPLHSKLADESDATVVTATLS